MADPLGELVHLTSLNLSSTCHGAWGVSRVHMHAVPCLSVRGRQCQCEVV